jgi:DNA-binding transcriptional ArsR family regulator
VIDALISSKTRIKLLMKFFLNGSTRSYLRSLEQEFGESTNGIRVELNRLEEAGMLTSEVEGNRRYFKANQTHPLYDQVHQIVLKTIGIDQIIERVIDRLGNVKKVFLIGRLASGLDSQIVDLVLVGDIDAAYLHELVLKAEAFIQRRIRTIVYNPAEFSESLMEAPALLLYQEIEQPVKNTPL